MAVPTDYPALAQLVTRHIRRGVMANTIVSQTEYAPALSAGTLSIRETPAGLLLLRDRGDHTRLHFYLNDLSVPLPAPLPSPTVTEVAFRPRDTGLQQAISYLQEQGFSPMFQRIRLSRPTGTATAPDRPLYTPGPADTPRVLAFLRETFSPLTGCLPTEDELQKILSLGHVLTLEESGAITGLIHFSLEGSTGEIRHLAIRADLRGTGRTRPLLAGYLQAVGGTKSIVWTRQDALDAQAAYHYFGFLPDGRCSAVLCYTEKEGI